MSTTTITEVELNQIRADHKRAPKVSGDRFAVIVKNSWLGTGVQYWTAEEIEIGTRKNTDHSHSIFLAKL